MRKIDKSTLLSTKYKAWEEALESSNTEHPEYHSNHKYYVDVVMNLLHAQDGLCAYTEQILCDEPLYDEKHWKAGRYNGKKLAFGELEHFDPSKKVKKAWLWDNFLMIDSQVNRLKRDKPVSYLLKPDSPTYDPFKLLAYDINEHIFIANPLDKSTTETEKQEINRMLREVFQINHPTIIRKRKDKLNPILTEYRLLQAIEKPSKAFPTALAMSLKILEETKK